MLAIPGVSKIITKELWVISWKGWGFVGGRKSVQCTLYTPLSSSFSTETYHLLLLEDIWHNLLGLFLFLILSALTTRETFCHLPAPPHKPTFALITIYTRFLAVLAFYKFLTVRFLKSGWSSWILEPSGKVVVPRYPSTHPRGLSSFT